MENTVETLLRLSGIAIAISSGIGWVLLLLTILIEKLFPRTEKTLERMLKPVAFIFGGISKWAFVTIIAIGIIGLALAYLGVIFDKLNLQ